MLISTTLVPQTQRQSLSLTVDRNYPDRLDPALGRAGRFDVRVPFFPAAPEQARALFLQFYPLDDVLSNDATVNKKTATRVSSQADIDRLADNFTKGIFGALSDEKRQEGIRVSMAALQGYLLRYKEDPVTAAEKAADWAKTLSGRKREVHC